MKNKSNILSTSLRSPATIFFSVLALLVAALLTEYFFFNPINQYHIQTIFDDLFSVVFKKRWINVSVVFFSVIFTSILLFRIDSKHKLLITKSSLCFAVYALIFSTNPSNLNNTYVPVFNLLGALAFNSMFDCYKLKKGYISYVFNVFFIFSFLSLMDFNALLYVPFLIYAIYMMRVLTSKTIIAIILGLVLPYWFYAFWCYHIDSFESLITLLTNNFTISWLNINQIQPYEWVHMSYTVLLSIISIKHALGSLRNTKIKVRALVSVMIVFMLYTILLTALNSSLSSMPISFFYLISSFLIARYFSMDISPYKSAIFVFSIFFYLTTFIWSLWLS
ncbi:MAG: hypothetical protein ACK5JU_05935 [Bacteroidales bacterium]